MSSIGSAPLPREPYAGLPYAGLPELPEFTLTSTDVQDGGTAPEWMRSALFGVAGGQHPLGLVQRVIRVQALDHAARGCQR